MITTPRAAPSPSFPLVRDFVRFDVAAVRRRDARTTRRLEAVATPCLAFAIGFLIACAL